MGFCSASLFFSCEKKLNIILWNSFSDLSALKAEDAQDPYFEHLEL